MVINAVWIDNLDLVIDLRNEKRIVRLLGRQMKRSFTKRVDKESKPVINIPESKLDSKTDLFFDFNQTLDQSDFDSSAPALNFF